MSRLRFLAGKNLTRPSRNLRVPPDEKPQGPILCTTDSDAAGDTKLSLWDVPTLEEDQGSPGDGTAIQLTRDSQGLSEPPGSGTEGALSSPSPCHLIKPE